MPAISSRVLLTMVWRLKGVLESTGCLLMSTQAMSRWARLFCNAQCFQSHLSFVYMYASIRLETQCLCECVCV